MKERFRETMSAHIKDKVAVSSEPAMYRNEGELLLSDLVMLLRYIKENEPELNQEGAMYRRYQQGVMNALHIRRIFLAKAAGDLVMVGHVSIIRLD